MHKKSRAVRESLSSPGVREFVLLAALFVGSHVFAVDAKTYASSGAAVPIAAGVLAGAIIRTTVDSERVSTVATATLVLAVIVGGLVGSWFLASILFGSAGESGRIPGFVLAVLAGSIVVRLFGSSLDGEGGR